MNEQQMRIFIQAAQMGISFGLYHPWEWLASTQRALHVGPWDELQQHAANLDDAFLAFWHGCGCQPHDPCESATIEELYNEVHRYFLQESAAQQGRHSSMN